MLVEKEIKKLASDKEYVKVFNYFHYEFTQLLRNFLERNGVELKEDDCLINYILKTRIFMPKYSAYTIPITVAMYNEKYPEEEKYELLLQSYEMVREVFSR